jgi:hypothetical protein
VNDIIIGRPKEKEDHNDDGQGGSSDVSVKREGV